MQLDKVTHALAGAVMALVVFIVLRDLGYSMTVAGLYGSLSSFAIGYGKEIWDHWQNKKAEAMYLPPKHTVDRQDLWATFAGGSAAMLGIQLLHFLTILILGA